MRGAAIERDLFNAAVRSEQDGAARRLIHAARFHADETVLDKIETADTIDAAKRIEMRE